jgi:hypothetical protein
MRRLLVIAGVVCAGSVAVLAQQTRERVAVFTAQQAEAGRIALRTNTFGDCSDCHARSLGGRTGNGDELPALASLREDYQKLVQGNGGRVPDLVGPGFRARWVSRTTKDLTAEFLDRFGPSSGGLSEDTRLNLIAYFLQGNGAVPGPQPLTMMTEVSMRLVVPATE